MLAIILLSVASPNVSDMTAVEQFSANLSDPVKQDELAAGWPAKWKADRQAVADANSRKPRPAYNCPPWKPGQKGELLRLVSVDDIHNYTSNEFEDCGDKRLKDATAYYNRTRPHLTEYQRQQAHVMALTGGKGLTASDPVDLTPNMDAELAAQAASVEKASQQEVAQRIETQRSMPLSCILAGGLLLLAIGFALGKVRKRT